TNSTLYLSSPIGMPPTPLIRSAQICSPSRPGLPQAATAPVSGARKPIFTTWSAPKTTLGGNTPANRAAAAVVVRNLRRSIALNLTFVVIGPSDSNGATIEKSPLWTPCSREISPPLHEQGMTLDPFSTSGQY